MFFLTVSSAILVFALVKTEASLASEPKCSNFHYEEQMLYKMVRVEHDMELLDIEVKDMGEKIEAFTERMGAKMEAFTESNLELRDKIENNIGNYRIELEDIEVEIEKQREDRVALKEKQFVRPPAFNVHSPTDTTPATNEVIVFKVELLNEGEGYDITTGVFTAPTAGLYMFTVHMCNYNRLSMHYGIVVEDNLVASSTQRDESAFSSCSSVNAVVRVNKGGRVYVKCTSGGSLQRIYNDPFRWNSFNGILLHE